MSCYSAPATPGTCAPTSNSLLKPPLPQADRDRLANLFGHLVGVGLDAPHLTPLSRRNRSG